MLLNSIQNTIKKFNVKSVLIGFSGGVDSTVLAYTLSKIENLNVRAVYVDHGLSEHSNEWESFCRDFCLKNNIKFYKESVDCSNLNGDSLEALAREKRYEVYNNLLEDNEYLCLGQHSNDQVETVLLQLFRGTGLSGLSGMPLLASFHNGYILRPFLDNDITTISKEVIESYAEENNIEHIFDESNNSNKFRRNFLRNEIIPKIEKEFGRIDKAIVRTAKNCAEANNYISDKALNIFEYKFNINLFDNLSKFEIKNSIQNWIKNNNFQPLSSKKLEELMKFINNYKTDSNFQLETKKYIIRHFNYNIYLIDKSIQKSENYSIPFVKNSLLLNRNEIGKNFSYQNKKFNVKQYFLKNKIPRWERDNFVFQVKNNTILGIYTPT
jgi:tRNA(Ile)-lysidine synthase